VRGIIIKKYHELYMKIKFSRDSDSNDGVRQQDVIRSIPPRGVPDTKKPADIISDSMLFKFFDRMPLTASYTMILYVVLYSLLFPPRFPNGDISITRILLHVYSFSHSDFLHDGLWVFTTILFILLSGFCCVLSVYSAVKYYRLRGNAFTYYGCIVLGIVSLIINLYLLIDNVSLLLFLITGLSRMF